jgi:carboxymethylenebutenolidase
MAADHFVAAAQPVQTHVFHTSNRGLVEGDIRVATASGDIPGYWAQPAAPGPEGGYPVMLVVQEIFGVHEHIRDVVRRFAHQGYLAVAIELFMRQGDVSGLTSLDEVLKIAYQAPDAQVLADLDASVAWAAEKGGNVQRLGICGFCWGGRIAWLYAAHQPKLKAAVAWYGRLEGEASATHPRHPIDVAAELKAPVLGLYGGEDAGIPPESVHRFEQALAKAASPSQMHVYPHAPHAFFADYRPSYHPDEAKDSWRRALEWFQQHGV